MLVVSTDVRPPVVTRIGQSRDICRMPQMVPVRARCRVVAVLLQIHTSLGPLVHATFQMMADLSRFGALILVVTLGFALAFYALFGARSATFPEGGAIDKYKTYQSALLTLFESMLGNFDFEVCDAVSSRLNNG